MLALVQPGTSDTQDAKFRSAVIEGKTKVAAHKNMAYDLKKKL
jgi:putative membrane protein